MLNDIIFWFAAQIRVRLPRLPSYLVPGYAEFALVPLEMGAVH